MPTVTIPGVGPVERRWVIGVGVGVGGYVLYRYWKAAHATPAADASLIDPQTGLPYATENLSGGGYVNPNPVTSVDTSTGNEVRTNQEWVSAVTADLTTNAGMDPSWVSSVLGDYLARQPLTSDQAATVRQAWAFRGKPPEGPDTYALATGTSTPGGGSTDPTPATAGVSAGAPVVATISGWQAQGWNVTLDGLEALNSGLVISNIRWDQHGNRAGDTWVASRTYRLK
jgi:hypothetical protein